MKRMPVNNIWEARVQRIRSRGHPKEDIDTAISRLILKRGKSILETSDLAKHKEQWLKFVKSG